MRIIAGDCKGRRLASPDWDGLRPTSDKLRETLFNILAPRTPGAQVLDLFAGTGAVGLEGLSRGAAQVTFIDSDRRAVSLIAANAATCGVQERCVIIRDTAEHALAQSLSGAPFDLALLDPPYGFEPLGAVVEAAMRHLSPGGLLILEHARRRTVPLIPVALVVRVVRSGDSALTMFSAA